MKLTIDISEDERKHLMNCDSDRDCCMHLQGIFDKLRREAKK